MNTFAITLAFCNVRLLRESLKGFYATRSPALPLKKHLLVDQHYPLEREANRAALLALADEFPVEIIDPGRNLGLHKGFNWGLDQCGAADDDVVIGYDGDSLPIDDGWDMALVRAIEGRMEVSDPEVREVVWSTLANPRTISDIQARGYHPTRVDGALRVWLTPTSITNSVCAWRVGWLRSVGGLHEPSEWYGHLESTMFAKLGRFQRWGVVPDFRESDELRSMHDRAYTAYKWFHSHTFTWLGDFKSFVEAGCPGVDTSPEEIP